MPKANSRSTTVEEFDNSEDEAEVIKFTGNGFPTQSLSSKRERKLFMVSHCLQVIFKKKGSIRMLTSK